MEVVYNLYDYLPIEDIEVYDYVNPLMNSAQVTFDKEEYQFAYFAVHLIFMTYIYSTIWKISQLHNSNYQHTLAFARAYEGKDKDFKEVVSVFVYSHIPEKEVFNFLKIIGFEKDYINSIKKLVDIRNEFAHANGKIQISTEESFNIAIEDLLSVAKNIHNKFSISIKSLYHDNLVDYAISGLNPLYSSVKEYIEIEFIKNLSFSKMELNSCKDFGISRFSNRNNYSFTKKQIKLITVFHKEVNLKFNDLFEIE